MAKTRRRRRNPTGTLLVNSGRRGRHSKRRARNPKRSRRAISLASLFRKRNPKGRRRTVKSGSHAGRRATSRRARAGRFMNPRRRGSRRRNPLLTNPRRRRGSRGRRRNPLLTNPRRRRSSKRRGSRRRNPLLTNPRRRGRGRRRNPLLTNPRRSRRGRGGRRHNPIMINRGRRGRGRRRNPGALQRMGKGFLGKAQGYAKRVPLLGGVLAAAIGGIGSALLGAVGVLPIDYAMPYVARFIPDWAKPFAYSAGGLILAGVVKAFPMKLGPLEGYRSQLAIGLTFAGGAVDSYRWRHNASQSLSGDMDGDWGDSDFGELEGELGDDGAALSAMEYGDTDLSDAEYSGDDLSADEMATAELGRRAYRKKYHRRPKKQTGSPADHGAGLPGDRWGWLIYWIGFDNFQVLASKPDGERKQLVESLRREAMLRARKLIGQNMDTSVAEAETAGLLALQ